MLSAIEINPELSSIATIIWLHGLGADGYDFVSLAESLKSMGLNQLRFVFPHAPLQPVTLNNKMMMRAWYDIESLDITGRIDQAGMLQSYQAILALIEHEMAAMPAHRIFLGGFSQGAAMALLTTFRTPHQLGGVMALSGYVPLTAPALCTINSPARETAIFMGHGTRDPLVPFLLGKTSGEWLSQQGFPLTWHSYPIEHQVSTHEIQDLAAWLKVQLQERDQTNVN